MNAENGSKNTVTTTATSFSILETIERHQGATISEIAEELDLAVSTVHRHLVTSLEEGYVVKDGTEYQIGLRFLELGFSAREQLFFFETAKDQIEVLAKRTDEKIRLTALEGYKAVLLYRHMGRSSLKTSSQIGNRRPLHQLAAGKAMLATLPREEIEMILDEHGLSARTDNTITDRRELFEALDKVRERGYGYNLEESIEGLNAVGAAFKDDDGYPLGAVSISGPANRIKGEKLHQELPELLLSAVNEIEINLKYIDNPTWG